jgi:PemK-like, MazF-like toxin of type II toxin-antitoxin system
VNVTQLRTVDRDRLTERIGSLSSARVQDVLRGLSFVFYPRVAAASLRPAESLLLTLEPNGHERRGYRRQADRLASPAHVLWRSTLPWTYSRSLGSLKSTPSLMLPWPNCGKPAALGFPGSRLEAVSSGGNRARD